MAHLRLIARLDIRNANLIKTINFEGVRVVGDPNEYALRYYADGADELLYMDVVASLYDRRYFTNIVRRTADNVFVPITAGGGVRTLEDVEELLRAGADKVAINTAATVRPDLVTEVATRFGSQCMVLSIEAKRTGAGSWEVYRDGGREHTGLDVIEWARRGQDLGAGEILLTSIDQEGTRRGFDVRLIHEVNEAARIPVIASGGLGRVEHLEAAVEKGGADAVAMASVLHYGVITLPALRDFARRHGCDVRTPAGARLGH